MKVIVHLSYVHLVGLNVPARMDVLPIGLPAVGSLFPGDKEEYTNHIYNTKYKQAMTLKHNCGESMLAFHYL